MNVFFMQKAAAHQMQLLCYLVLHFFSPTYIIYGSANRFKTSASDFSLSSRSTVYDMIRSASRSIR